MVRRLLFVIVSAVFATSCQTIADYRHTLELRYRVEHAMADVTTAEISEVGMVTGPGYSLAMGFPVVRRLADGGPDVVENLRTVLANVTYENPSRQLDTKCDPFETIFEGGVV